jgi:predicted DNA binding CopG/RHH family protein
MTRRSETKINPYNAHLDEEEQELLNSFERGEWKSVENLEEESRMAKEAAANYLCKDARVNLRISSGDLACIKQRAAYKGLPYQTLIASVLHEYAAGHFEGQL